MVVVWVAVGLAAFVLIFSTLRLISYFNAEDSVDKWFTGLNTCIAILAVAGALYTFHLGNELAKEREKQQNDFTTQRDELQAQELMAQQQRAAAYAEELRKRTAAFTEKLASEQADRAEGFQKKFNMPLADIIVGDYFEDVNVNLVNVGTGTMLVHDITYSYIGEDGPIKNDDGEKVVDLAAIIPPLPPGVYLEDFQPQGPRKVQPVGAEVYLLQFLPEGTNNDSNERLAYKAKLREFLSRIKVEVEYSPTWDEEHRLTAGRELDLFARRDD